MCLKQTDDEGFQFTTSQGGRRVCCSNKEGPESFNSRPHKEVDCNNGGDPECLITFNSRPHKEVDRRCCPLLNLSRLSIHDLTRRSTTKICTYACICALSIHDLTRRSTPDSTKIPTKLPFQFTTSQGGRR